MTSSLQGRSNGPGVLPWLSLVTVWILWGSTYLNIRIAVESIPPLLMAGSRYLLAGVLLAAILLVTQRKRLGALGASDFKYIVISALLLPAIGNGSLTFSERTLPSGTASLIVACVPIWVLVVEALHGQRIRARALGGIALGMVGLLLLVGSQSHPVPLLPASIVAGGAFSWALGSVIMRRRNGSQRNPIVPALEMIVAGLVLLVAGLATRELPAFHPDRITAPAIGGFTWLVVMGSIVAYTAYGYAVRTLPTSAVATYAYVNPIVAVALGTTLLKEPLTPNVLGGGAVIILSVVMTLLWGSEPGQGSQCVQAGSPSGASSTGASLDGVQSCRTKPSCAR
jgi:drug/metabolite transporter (DMT)-like permease